MVVEAGLAIILRKKSDTDEYQEEDEMDDYGDSIPCSQMRDVPHMLQ